MLYMLRWLRLYAFFNSLTPLCRSSTVLDTVISIKFKSRPLILTSRDVALWTVHATPAMTDGAPEFLHFYH